MVMSLRVMTAGAGYRYLLSSVVSGDGERDLSSPLTRYYQETGTPPGVWHGTGVTALSLDDGLMVSEQQLERLLGHGLHPLTGKPLGRAYPVYPGITQRIAGRVAQLNPDIEASARGEAVARIEQEERAKTPRHAVAGFDLTFSVPKSVSVLWGLSDQGTQQLIAQAHHEAVAACLGLFERQVACTRTGVTKPASAQDGGGAIVQSDVTGVAIACFDHYDSRAGDPQLHTHCVVSAKVRTIDDGKWRSLDSRPVHHAANAMSEHYNAILADILARDMGFTWQARNRGANHNPAWEIDTVPETLIRLFSKRGADIDRESDTLIGDYIARHGHRPSRETIIELRHQATLATRPAKQIHSLAELTTNWRGQTLEALGRDASSWPNMMTDESVPLLRADDIPLDQVSRTAEQVLAKITGQRSTWKHWTLWAEATRQTMGWRFATPADRETITGLIVETAEHLSMRLTPSELATPERLKRGDGTSRLRPSNTAVYTSQAMWDAEEHLLTIAQDANGPTAQTVGTNRTHRDVQLGPDQQDALERVATSGLVLDVLVGPAGAGKTTIMSALKTAWEAAHGPQSVIGLAPSATAAQVLSQELGIPTENTAKWLTDHDYAGTKFKPGQLVIIDEASLAGTFTLDRIATLAAQTGAKVLLVGDPNQLQAVEAGGAFNLIVQHRDDAPQLSDIHRFTNQWEKTASLELRLGNPAIIDTYNRQGRIHEGDTEQMRQAAYQAWLADTQAGYQTILIADDRSTVTELNRQARHDRIIAGLVDPTRDTRLAEDTRASVGDIIITRRNDRRLIAGRTGWVRNGDRWTITRIHGDGSIAVRRVGHTRGATVVLPAPYVDEHVDLGYAITAYRAQGITVDTSHAVITTHTPRENLYVALTRGRDSNTAYVTTDTPITDIEPLRADEPTTAKDVLAHVLRTTGAEPSAHQAQQDEQQRWNSLPQLVAEYEQIANEARRDYNALPEEQKAELLRQRVTSRTPTRQHMLAGLIPEPGIPMDADLRKALNARRDAIEKRVTILTRQTISNQPAWLQELGSQPDDKASHANWAQALRVAVSPTVTSMGSPAAPMRSVLMQKIELRGNGRSSRGKRLM